jgi:hypothetical protein
MNEDYNYGEPKERPQRNPGPTILAIVAAISAIFVAYVQFVLPNKVSIQATQTAESKPTTAVVVNTPEATATVVGDPPVQTKTGRLAGILTDREGNLISDMSVSVRNGPATKTDIEGKFVLNDVAEGDQLIVVKPPSGDGQFTLNITVLAEQTNNINIVYDAASSRLGLLSITAPVDGGDLDIRQDVGDDGVLVHRATIFGRCDGLSQIFQGEFDVWVLVSSERDGKFWVQFPPAIIDPNDNTWRANIVLGDAEHPPLNGELWTIVAAAASLDSGFDRILNTPRLSLLPPHITSNVISIESQIQ